MKKFQDWLDVKLNEFGTPVVQQQSQQSPHAVICKEAASKLQEVRQLLIKLKSQVSPGVAENWIPEWDAYLKKVESEVTYLAGH